MAINAPVSIEAFEKFIHQPDNRERLFELIAGDIIEVVSNNYSSMVAIRVAYLVQRHMESHNIEGDVTGADGGYEIGAERYIPDVAYISATRQPQPSHEAYNSLAPDLAVEVLSPTDDARTIRIKVANYLAVNVVVWVVNPDEKTVEVYRPGKPVTLHSSDDTIDGSPVFPQLELPVTEIFPSR